MTIKLDPMQLTPADMRRARVMLSTDGEGEEPYEILDAQDDVTREKRRVLLYWCFRTRDDPSFTWQEAWDTPFAVLLEAETDEDTQGPPTPGSEQPPSGPGTPPISDLSGTRPAAEPVLNSSATSG